MLLFVPLSSFFHVYDYLQPQGLLKNTFWELFPDEYSNMVYIWPSFDCHRS